jgi:serine/threonine-protein kinase HipA
MDYPQKTFIEVHHAGRWHVAAELTAFSGHRMRVNYLDSYVFGPIGVPVSLRQRVSITSEPMVEGLAGPEPDRRPAPFLYDLVPQGRGRAYLLSKLQLADADDERIAPLLMAGAFNPVGNLRISSAVDFYKDAAAKDPSNVVATGFTFRDIADRSEEFLEHISLHSMLAAGTTGVQGVAPKFLLTTNAGDRWFADLALADKLAHEHWLVKLPRGRHDDDRSVLRNEAAYLRLAAACGLHCRNDHKLVGEMLFVRRFDRVHQDGMLHRLHQESLASIVGQRGFGQSHAQQSLVAGIRQVVDDPLQQTIEFIKRDVLNLAMRNTDNHARNTAIQRTVDGRIALTPLFDFAPMFKDPEVVARSCLWRDKQGVRQDDWTQIIENLDVPDDEIPLIQHALNEFGRSNDLETRAQDCGVEKDVLAQCKKSIEKQLQQLERLPRLPSIQKDEPKNG